MPLTTVIQESDRDGRQLTHTWLHNLHMYHDFVIINWHPLSLSTLRVINSIDNIELSHTATASMLWIKDNPFLGIWSWAQYSWTHCHFSIIPLWHNAKAVLKQQLHKLQHRYTLTTVCVSKTTYQARQSAWWTYWSHSQDFPIKSIVTPRFNQIINSI